MAAAVLALSLGFAAPVFAEDEEPAAKLPLPRFASIKPDEANVRLGPGTRYAIQWVYKRPGMPVEIIQEFDQWREIRDYQGSIGWAHKGMLEGKRNLIITGEVRVLRREPSESAAPVLRVEPGVMGKLIECDETWCRIQIDSRKGWLKKSHMWGVYPKEVF